MKVRKTYPLYINSMLGTATFGNAKFGRRIDRATIGQIFDCTLSELKDNLRMLIKRGYTVSQRKY